MSAASCSTRCSAIPWRPSRETVAGNATGLAASTRYAGPPLRYGLSDSPPFCKPFSGGIAQTGALRRNSPRGVHRWRAAGARVRRRCSRHRVTLVAPGSLPNLTRFNHARLMRKVQGDTASPAAQRLVTTGRVLPAITDRRDHATPQPRVDATENRGCGNRTDHLPATLFASYSKSGTLLTRSACSPMIVPNSLGTAATFTGAGRYVHHHFLFGKR